MNSRLPELESHLASDRWLRRLAGRLARDPGVADDLVQETWLSSLHESRTGAGARPWLARVLRNAWRDHVRGNRRREYRERVVAAAEAVESTDDLAAELELRERLLRALRELEEPHRSTLVRRFFRDESLGTIARADGVALSTVHERIERGLARLRARLDAEHGGRRGVWAATMLAFARRSKGTLGTGGLAVAAAWMTVVACVLVGGWWLTWRGTSASDPLVGVGSAPDERSVARQSGPTSAVGPKGSETREPGASLPAPPGSEPEPELVIRGRIVSIEGAPVPFVDVEVARGPLERRPRARSSGDGRFTLTLAPEHVDGAVRCPDARYVTLVGAHLGLERLVVVARARTVVGRVVDPQGLPIGGAALRFRLLPGLFRELGIEVAAADEQPGWSATSDASGLFRLAPVAAGPHLVVEARARGFLSREVGLAELVETDGELLIALQPDARARLLSGRVFGPDGRPFAGARVSAGDEIVLSAADGRFELEARLDTGRSVQDEGGAWRPEARARARVIALAPALGAGMVEVELDQPAGELVLSLTAAALSISGRVVEADGSPRAGVVLWPRAQTHFGRVPRGLSETGEELTVEAELCATDLLGVVSDANGAFELGCLLDQVYDLDLFDSRTCGRSVVAGVQAGREGLEVRFEPEPATLRVAGRAISSTGDPVPGLEIRPRRVNFDRTPVPEFVGAEFTRRTDAEGRFEFEALAMEGTVLDVFSLPWRSVTVAEFPDFGNIEIVVPTLRELQVELSDPDRAEAFVLLDAEGRELELVEMTRRDKKSLAFTMATRAALTAGRSSVVRAPDTATTLVLLRAGVEVLRLPLVFEESGPTRIRF